MTKLDRLGWAATAAIRVGSLHLGVRSHTEDSHDLLRDLLGDQLVDDPEAPANYSLVFGDEDGEGQRELNQVYRSSTLVVRSRQRARALRGLLAWLRTHTPPPDDLLRVQALAVVGDDRAVLAPSLLLISLQRLEPRFRRRGLRVLDGTTALVEPTTLELVVPPPPVEFDGEVMAGIEREDPPARSEVAPVGPGRYPLAGWAWWRRPPDAPPVTPAHRVGQATHLVTNVPTLGSQRALELLASVVTGTEQFELGEYEPADITARLAAALAR